MATDWDIAVPRLPLQPKLQTLSSGTTGERTCRVFFNQYAFGILLKVSNLPCGHCRRDLQQSGNWPVNFLNVPAARHSKHSTSSHIIDLQASSNQLALTVPGPQTPAGKGSFTQQRSQDVLTVHLEPVRRREYLKDWLQSALEATPRTSAPNLDTS